MGKSLNFTEKIYINIKPNQKLGMEIPVNEKNLITNMKTLSQLAIEFLNNRKICQKNVSNAQR